MCNMKLQLITAAVEAFHYLIYTPFRCIFVPVALKLRQYVAIFQPLRLIWTSEQQFAKLNVKKRKNYNKNENAQETQQHKWKTALN